MKGNKPRILLKYGGNAMTDETLKRKVLQNICALKDSGYDVVIVHGGGPFIKKALEVAQIKSEFIDGHRKTTPEALMHVEMALKGEVNGSLVGLINQLGYKAVGLSGKDGKFVTAKKRLHEKMVDGKLRQFDLGQVGDVVKINPELIETLLEGDYIPVVTCIAADEEGKGYNINADMFAGHLAGAIGAKEFLVLTDVDGLRRDKDNPETLISELKVKDIKKLEGEGVIQGGMIPKMEACSIAVEKGAKAARIINGTKPEQLRELSEGKSIGTLITK
jgi:acetylglutamate kinase